MISTAERETRIEIELLKKDVTTMSALLEKFDVTMEKMQEIATSLSRMVSLHEQRLETHEKITREVQEILEMRRQEHSNNIKDVYDRINTVNKELTDKIEDTEKTILQELKKLHEEISSNKEGFGIRLGQIEMWKYGIGIVIIVFAWFIGETEFLTKLFN